MSEDKEISEERAAEVLGGFGNTGYLWTYIEYFEKKIPEEVSGISEGHYYPHILCPNHAAWLRFYTEVISLKTLHKVFVKRDCDRSIDEIEFTNAVNVIEKCALDISKGNARLLAKIKIKNLKTVIEIRHSIQHGGLPNIHRRIRFTEIKKDELTNIILPLNYLLAKDVFASSNELLESLPKKHIIAYANGTYKIGETNNVIKKTE